MPIVMDSSVICGDEAEWKCNVMPIVMDSSVIYVGMKLSENVAAASISCFIQAHCFCGAAGSFHHIFDAENR